MSLSYDITIRPLNREGLKIKAIASVTFEGLMLVDGFKIIEGSKGLFVSVPNHKGTIMEEGVKVEKYFDDVRFIGEQGVNFGYEVKDAILAQYRSGSNASSNHQEHRATSAKAHTKASQKTAAPQESKASEDSSDQTSQPERTRKPLWNFT